MDLSSWLKQTITVQSPSGLAGTGYTDAAWGSQSSIPARVEVDQRMIRNAAGEMVAASHTIFTTSAITILDRIWLPGADTSNVRAARRPLMVSSATRKDGTVSHYEVTL